MKALLLNLAERCHTQHKHDDCLRASNVCTLATSSTGQIDEVFFNPNMGCPGEDVELVDNARESGADSEGEEAWDKFEPHSYEL